MHTAKILSSRYRLDSIIGEGGSGVVYKGFDLIIKGNIAIKVLKDGDCFKRIENVMRLKKEAAAVSRLEHPGIVKVFDVGTSDDLHFLIMEYIEGQSLDSLIKHQTILPLSLAIAIVRRIGETLAYVHDAGIIHRDIKPGNIILTGYPPQSGTTVLPKIGDFGLSRFINYSKSERSETSGTYCYMSPEQAGLIRHPVDTRTDLYSLGILLYRLLTGRLPFQGRNVQELFTQMITLAPQSPSRINPEIPEILDTVIGRLFEKDPEKRYQNANDLCNDLNRIEKGESLEKPSCDDPARRITFRTRHIGREKQQEHLRDAFRNALRGGGGVCLISGDSGSGKTRLCDEFATWVLQQNALCLNAVCLSYENQSPYQVFADLLMQYINQVKLMPEALGQGYRRKIRSSAGELAGLLGKLNPLLTEVLGDLPEVVPLETEKEHKRFISVCANVFLGLGDIARPAVLFLDDLQWTDQGSMEILYDIWLHINAAPLVIVGCYREKEVSADHPLMRCRSQARFSELPLVELPLDPFSQKDGEELLHALMRTRSAWTSELAAFVVRKSAGNPLYALEIVRQLVKKEVLFVRNGRWGFDRGLLAQINVPEAMADAVMTRLSSIDNRLADLLSLCALVGKRFSLDFLITLPDMGSGESIVTQLETAVELELIEWDANQEGFLIFVHDRIRESFEERLSHDQRTRVHGIIGTVLEKNLPVSEKDTLFLLVHHFSRAGDWRRSLRYSLEAAKKAQDAYAITLAIHYYELSKNLIEEHESRENLEWKTAAEGLIELYPIAGSVEKANALANDLFAYAKTKIERARLHRIIGANYTRVSSFDRAEDHFARGLSLLGRRIPTSRVAAIIGTAVQLAWYPLTSLFWPVRADRKKEKVSERDREIALFYQNASMLFVVSDYIRYFWVTLALMNHARRTLGASKELAGAISSYAMIYTAFPWISRCLFHHDRALAIKQSIGDRPGVAESHYSLGFAYCIDADWEKALHHMSLAQGTYEAIGNYYQLVHVLNGQQNIHFLHTDTEKRLPVLRKLLSVSERIGNHYGTSISLTGLGGHYLMLGEIQTSKTFLDKAVEFGSSTKQWLSVCIAQTNRARLYLGQRDLDRALEYITLAAEVEQKYSLLKPVVAVRYVIMVEVLAARFLDREQSLTEQEKRKSLTTLRREVRKMMSAAKRWPIWRGDAISARAEYHRCCGDSARADADYTTAIAHLAKVGKKFELARAYFHYARFLIQKERRFDAVPLLHSALDIFRKIGARHHIDLTLTLLGEPAEKRDEKAMVASTRLASLLEVTRSISSLQDLEPLLNAILSKAVEVTGATRGYLCLTDGANRSGLQVSHNSPSNEPSHLPFSKSIIEQVRNTGQTVLTVNAAHQEPFKQFESISTNDMKSILCTPILRRRQVLGVCYLDNSITSGVFDGGDREMLEAFMAQAAVCIENARAFEEIRNHNARLAEERDRIWKRNAELQNLVQFQASHIRSFGEVHLVTQNSAMLNLIDQAKRFADSQAPVLITGSSGSGKEIFAHLLHHSGRRKDGPFVKVNCSTIPETLFESEFFGYEKGAFTGASLARKGKFELANGGTLMLDEIADLPLSQQAKLLRVLEENTITPVGGSSPRKVNVRVVTATNKDIARLVTQNKFREDLYFRLSVLNLVIPPLSRRPDDIPVLASYFLSSIANAEGGREKRFDDPALLELRKMPFSGNVRELKNLVHRLYVTHDKEIITADDVRQGSGKGESTKALVFQDNGEGLPDSFFHETRPFRLIKEEFEKQYLRAQLKKHDLNLTKTAKAIGLLPSALSRKLKELEIGLDGGGKEKMKEGSQVRTPTPDYS